MEKGWRTNPWPLVSSVAEITKLNGRNHSHPCTKMTTRHQPHMEKSCIGIGQFNQQDLKDAKGTQKDQCMVQNSVTQLQNSRLGNINLHKQTSFNSQLNYMITGTI